VVAVSELVAGSDAELVRLGSNLSTMAWYQGCWRHRERFFASCGVQEFSLDLATASLLKPSTTTPSPPTWPTGTKIPSCSAGSPTSDPAQVMRSVRSL
jgi:hypothetical protein